LKLEKKAEKKTTDRKMEHIKICLEEDVESPYSGLEDVMLIHNALPDINFGDIQTEVDFFGKKLKAPLLIASMTGGHVSATKINKNLAIAVEELGLGMGVGSQRAAIESKNLEDTTLLESFTVVRDFAPNAFIYANVGLPQVVEYGVGYVEKAIEMIDADAVAIHLNFLQEAIQPEGDLDAKGGLKAISDVCKELKKPVIIKETGAGITGDVARLLRDAGASVIDVGGKGGTTWSGVETYRINDIVHRKIGVEFWDWGVPTAFCIPEVYDVLPTISTGGIRTGLDIAKSIALGAVVGSAALPFLRPATKSPEKVKDNLEMFINGLKISMFLTGCSKVDDLRNIPLFIHGLLREWMELRGIEVFKFSRRR